MTSGRAIGGGSGVGGFVGVGETVGVGVSGSGVTVGVGVGPRQWIVRSLIFALTTEPPVSTKLTPLLPAIGSSIGNSWTWVDVDDVEQVNANATILPMKLLLGCGGSNPVNPP